MLFSVIAASVPEILESMTTGKSHAKQFNTVRKRWALQKPDYYALALYSHHASLKSVEASLFLNLGTKLRILENRCALMEKQSSMTCKKTRSQGPGARTIILACLKGDAFFFCGLLDSILVDNRKQYQTRTSVEKSQCMPSFLHFQRT